MSSSLNDWASDMASSSRSEIPPRMWRKTIRRKGIAGNTRVQKLFHMISIIVHEEFFEGCGMNDAFIS